MYDPVILKNVFDDEYRNRIIDDCDRIWNKKLYMQDATFSRSLSNDNRLWMYLDKLLPVAREVFGEEDILPSYACWSMYHNPSSNLMKHKDKNACTFTLDYCVRQREPWGIYIEGEEYLLEPNEALAFMGEDQEHWRGSFSVGNIVEMIFFHYVRPNHWYFD